jgi:hypothetical protein
MIDKAQEYYVLSLQKVIPNEDEYLKIIEKLNNIKNKKQ